jgi:hypothetical protein
VIPVDPVAEPSGFDERARRPGNAWLAKNEGAGRPRDYWSPFCSKLADGFANRCGYTAMYAPVGTVDHFRSYKTNPELAYEWANYRYAAAWINSAKKTSEVLDPFEIGEGWFEVLLPSLQLVQTDKVPPESSALVERTLKCLPIGHDERVMKQRRRWYELYREGHLSLKGLREMAPMIAAAEEKRLMAEAAIEDVR